MVEVENLKKEFRVAKSSNVQALKGVSFNVREGTVFTLLGPSGCGKTTTLRTIAGLEEPTSGVIRISGQEVFNSGKGVMIPAEKRNIGMVFQSYAIWPHMTVFDNVAFPLRVPGAKRPRQEIAQRVRDVLLVVGLEQFVNRQATQLSGGQQQRLALARAMVSGQGLILLDEPLSNLDAKLREQMRLELKNLQKKLGSTTIYVTHDQTEALALSDEIAVMCDGEITQIGTPQEIYNYPQSRFVADFIGTTNFVPGQVISRSSQDGALRVETRVGELLCSSHLDNADTLDNVTVCIRPENVDVSLGEWPKDSAYNMVTATVDTIMFMGEANDVALLLADGSNIRVKVHSSTNLRQGQRVYLRVSIEKAVVVPDKEGETEILWQTESEAPLQPDKVQS